MKVYCQGRDKIMLTSIMTFLLGLRGRIKPATKTFKNKKLFYKKVFTIIIVSLFLQKKCKLCKDYFRITFGSPLKCNKILKMTNSFLWAGVSFLTIIILMRITAVPNVKVD